VRETLTFPNGQIATVAAAGAFSVYRPSASLDGDSSLLGPVTNEVNYMTSGDVMFCAIVESNRFSGRANWTQLINRNITGDGFDFVQIVVGNLNTRGDFYLDNDLFYNTVNDKVGGEPEHTLISQNETMKVQFSDRPGVGLTAASFVSINDSFKTYLIFSPDPASANNIWVTLGCVYWGWSGYAAYAPGYGWQLIDGSTNAFQFNDTDEFPKWTKVYSNSR